MDPHVLFILPDGSRAVLRPGDLIGRSDRAALPIAEPHISEAHAMLSLRAGELRLLALRGRISVDGKSEGQVSLRVGQRVLLGSRTALTVGAVSLPDSVWAVRIDGGAPALIGSVSALSLTPSPRVVGGFAPDAAAAIWTTGERLFIRDGEGPAVQLEPGKPHVLGEHTVETVRVPLAELSRAPTDNSAELGAALHLILNFDTVHIVAGPRLLTLDGIPARIVSELAAIGAPVAWQEVATQLWDDLAADDPLLRDRWDSSLSRLRRKLRGARLRSNLVHCTRAGLVELVLAPGDTVEDRM